jgi:dolichyl-phosphate-mannose--protein O-mannosyl transferase
MLWAATENWWLTVVISVATMGAGVALGLWALVRRMRRGEQLELGEGGFSLTQIVLVTGVGTYLASLTLESVVYAFFGLVGTLFAGLFLALVMIGRPEAPTKTETQDHPDA